MAFKDFRDYLDSLEKNGLLLRVTKEVSPRFEIAAGIRKICDNEGPALLFENIKGHPGWRVVGGLFATRKLMAFALQTEEDERKLLEYYLEYGQQRIKPVLVQSGPVKEVIIKGDDVDLSKLPIPTYCEMDAGPYLTAGVEIARDPITGIQNASFHRRLILGKDKTSLLVYSPTRHIAGMIRAAEKQGQSLGVATVIGAHPALVTASNTKTPAMVDEVEIAGAFRGKPFEVVKCETIDTQVPADAEIVIEGIVIPGEMVDDGPYGEFPGNYITLGNIEAQSNKPIAKAHIVKVTAITMRQNAIFHALLNGMPPAENTYLSKWGMIASIYRIVTQLVPDPEDICGINRTSGSAGLTCLISIRKTAESTARNIIYSVLPRILAGCVTVVDEDVDIYNPLQVEWAIATRVRPDRDIIILTPVPAPPEALTNKAADMYKWGIDATAPLTREPWLYKKAVPPEVSQVDYV
ncbi:UbiD family decarboxylase [Chloroflexota bacterium]